jgi:hypothetical protein
MVGGEALEGVVDLLDEGQRGGLELALEDGLAWVEPGPVIVAGEAAEELERIGSEVSGDVLPRKVSIQIQSFQYKYVKSRLGLCLKSASVGGLSETP